MKKGLLKHYPIVITGGFAVFSMFFGAGNLVFPLMLGAEYASSYGSTAAGFLTTAICMPFLGLLSMILFKGDRAEYFNIIGKKPAFLLTFILLCLMGPFGAIPRCIIVAYGGMQLMFPSLPLWTFSILFCLVNLWLVWNYNKIVPIIGNLLTPWFIACLLAILIAAFSYKMPETTSFITQEASSSFTVGVTKGYQTLDLLAAFFFSATTVRYLRSNLSKKEETKELITLSTMACGLGEGLLGLSYIGLMAVGAKFAPLLHNVSSEQILTVIAEHSLGPIAVPIVSITIFLACLTTVAVLVTLFGDFLNEDIFKQKLGRHTGIYVTLILSFLMSMIGFMRLYKGLASILLILYPALIALVIGSILGKLLKKPSIAKWAFWGTVAGSIALRV